MDTFGASGVLGRMTTHTRLASAVVLGLFAACSSTNDGNKVITVASDGGVACTDGAADAAPDFGPPPSGAGPIVYVGGFRPEIDVFRLDMATSKLTQIAQVANPPP